MMCSRFRIIYQLFQKLAGVDPSLQILQERLKYTFHDVRLLDQALTHPSFAAEKTPAKDSNQRLEFLGDGVLGHLVNEYLYQNFQQKDEGSLTRKKARLVRSSTLAEIAQSIDLGQFLKLGVGESRTGGHLRISNLADTFEAILGAIYLDGGINAVNCVLSHLLFCRLDHYLHSSALKNYKSALQEKVQQYGDQQPVYQVISETGPDHNKTYVVQVLVNGIALGQGEGSSKKRAEQVAACNALQNDLPDLN